MSPVNDGSFGSPAYGNYASPRIHNFILILCTIILTGAAALVIYILIRYILPGEMDSRLRTGYSEVGSGSVSVFKSADCTLLLCILSC